MESLPQKVDLPNVVFNDDILVNLFVERLKLAYAGPDAAKGQSKEELEEGIKREKEIVAQLAEIDESLASLAASDQTKKAAAKPPPKGAKGVAPEEALREELDTLRRLQPQGWILVDFPRNLTQMKMLEAALSGYISSADLAKPESQLLYEAWSKVASPSCLVPESTTGELSALPSGFDGVLIMNTPNSECTRRSQNRKIDPTN